LIKGCREGSAIPTLVSLGVVAAMAGLAGCGERSHADLRAGMDVYTVHCSSCHQPDGQGFDDVYPNLAGNPIVLLTSPEPVIDVVRRGRGSMPSFADDLSPRELADVISYIRNAWGNHASSVSPRQAG
jgi:mono/diheme cytochrome c family protein